MASKRFIFLALTMIFYLNFSACSNEESNTDGASYSGEPPPPPGQGGNQSPSTPGIVEETAMYMQVAESAASLFTSHISREGVFGEDCSIPNGSENQHIECQIDLIEQDLYFYPFPLEINVPSDMCEFITFHPYWYYNYEVGIGPKLITLDITKNDEGVVLSFECGVGTSVTTADACNDPNDEISFNNTGEDVSVKCVYDKSDSSDGVNCCLGDYVLNRIERVGSESTNSSTEQSWGDDVLPCLGGSIWGGWPSFDDAGYPMGEILSGKTTGANRTYNFSANQSSMNNENNFYLANYSDRSGIHDHDGFYNTRTSNLPYAIDPIDDRSGSLLYTTHQSYELWCWDTAYELKNSIQMFIREWNTVEEFLLFSESNISDTDRRPGNPNVVGIEGTACDYQSPYTRPCNDRADWRDLLDGLNGLREGINRDLDGVLGSYTTDPTNASVRSSFFPQDK